MKSPLRIGAFAAPKRSFPSGFSQPPAAGKARRIASLSAAAAMVVGVGAASALFVDYLADRALAREADGLSAVAKPVVAEPVVAQAVEASAETKVTALLPAARASSRPVEPPRAEIAAATPDPEAIARVAVGPEHAIELPTDDPTASPAVHADEVSAITAYAGEADGTQTAAIDPAEAAFDEQPIRKPAQQKAGNAEPAVEQDTEIASLPGVDVGGMAGHSSDDDDNSADTARTARITTAVNMRSSPKKGSSVLTVVPAGSVVSVLSCDGWCRISYDGRQGWVYKSFLTGSKAPKKAAASSSPKQPAAKSEPRSASGAEAAAPAQRKGISSRL